MKPNKSTFEIGQWAEKIAADFLTEKGYEILHTNWRAERGDIDIIALHHSFLVFVEVKGGSSEIFGPPELRITEAKKRQVYKLATLFLAQNEDSDLGNQDHRFDVVVVDGTENKFSIRHYENAFSN
jgi:putative endonuclease